MRVLGLVLLAFVFLVSTPTSGHPDHFVDGFVNADGYTFRGGLWYYPGYTDPYTRTLITTPARFVNGCYVAGTSYYQYARVTLPVAAAPAPVTPPPYTPNWKSDAIKYAEARDDYAAYLATLRSLGIQGQQYSFQQGTYGSGYGQLPLFGANATTPYSYSYQSLASMYGDTNLNQLYQQSAQLTQGAQKLAGDAFSGHSQLVGQAGRDAASLAQILAKGQTAEQILRALNGPNTVQTNVNVQGHVPLPPAQKPQEQPQQPKAGGSSSVEALQSLIGDRCAACHSGARKEGGIDLANYLQFSRAQKEKVWESLLTNDARKRMPRTETGAAGTPLTPAEMQLFFAN